MGSGGVLLFGGRGVVWWGVGRCILVGGGGGGVGGGGEGLGVFGEGGGGG